MQTMTTLCVPQLGREHPIIAPAHKLYTGSSQCLLRRPGAFNTRISNHRHITDGDRAVKNRVSDILANISMVLKLHYFKVKGLPQQSSG